MLEAQPLWKNVRTRHDDDIESDKLSHYTQNPVYCGHLVIPLMKNLSRLLKNYS